MDHQGPFPRLRRFRFFFSAGAVGAAVVYWVARRYVVLVLLGLTTIATGLAVGPGALLAIAAILISCAVLGRWLFRESDAALGFLGGLAAWAFAIAVLARVPIHYPAVYWSLLLAVPALRMRDTIGLLVSLRDRVLRRPALTPSAYVAFSLLALLLGAQWFAAIKPEASTDGLAMHLAIATNIVQKAMSSGRYGGAIWLERSPGVEESIYWLNLLIDGFFVLAWLFSLLLEVTGLLPVAPGAPLPGGAIPLDAAGVAAMAAIALVVIVGWLAVRLVAVRAAGGPPGEGEQPGQQRRDHGEAADGGQRRERRAATGQRLRPAPAATTRRRWRAAGRRTRRPGRARPAACDGRGTGAATPAAPGPPPAGSRGG